MSQLIQLDHKGQRVLLTAQLAEMYGTDSKVISYNFNRNKERYTEGKHFFALEGEEKRDLLNRLENHDGLKNAAIIYLWLKKGAALHAKSLGTDEAWDMYEKLVDDYFDRVAKLPPMTQSELVAYLAQQNVERERADAERDRRIQTVEQKIEDAVEVLALNPGDSWRKDTTALLNKIAKAKGGGEAFSAVREESYRLLEARGNYKLETRKKNIQSRMSLEGATKTKINAVAILDVISEEKRMIEIYIAIVKEMAIKNGIKPD